MIGARRQTLRRDDELGRQPQEGRDQRGREDRRREDRHQHALDAAGAFGLVRADVVAAVAQVDPELEGGRVDVQREPQLHRHDDALHAEGEEQARVDRAEHPADGHRRVERRDQDVVQRPARREHGEPLPELGEQHLERSPRPAHLLAEEVTPGRRALADREDVGRVDRLPAPARLGVAAGVELQAGGHVLGDRVRQAADALEGADPDGVVRPHQHRGVVAVGRTLDEAVERELLGLGGPGHERLVVRVALRADDEGDVLVAEVAQDALGVVRQRDVVGIDRQEHLVGVAVLGDPGVVVAVLGLRLEGTPTPVVLVHALAREVVDPELAAHRPHAGVVALVEDPDVEDPVVLDAQGGLQGAADDVHRLLVGHDRRQEGDALVGYRRHRDRVPGDHRGQGQRQHVDQAQRLHQADRADDDPVRVDRERRADDRRAVRRVQQPQEEERLEGEVQAGDEQGADDAAPAVDEVHAAVGDAVGTVLLDALAPRGPASCENSWIRRPTTSSLSSTSSAGLSARRVIGRFVSILAGTACAIVTRFPSSWHTPAQTGCALSPTRPPPRLPAPPRHTAVS